MRLFRRRDENDRPYGPYYAQWYDADGKRHERSTRAIDKKAADDIARGWERDAADPAYATARDTTLTYALTRYFDELDELVKAGRRSKDTYDSYKKKAGHLVRIFEYEGETYVPFQLAKLSAVLVKGFISKRRGEQVKESTIHKELVVLRAVLQTAKIDGIWFGDLDAIVPPKFTPDYRPKTRFLTPEELPRLLQELPGDRAAVVAFIVATSAEWRTVTLARRSDVAKDRSTVLLRGTKRKTRFRTVPIVSDDQRELLEFALEYAAGKDDALFLPWNNNVRRDLHAACRRTGCRATGCFDDPGRSAPCQRADCAAAAIAPCSPNDLRRTFATWLRSAGATPDLIAPMMGHSSTRMVETVYGRLPVSALVTRLRAALDSSDSPADPLDSVAFAGLPGPAGNAETACFSVPRDGVEPPTRGFSIPAEPAGNATHSIVLGSDGTHLGHARGLDAAMTAQVLGALDAGLADVAQGLLRKLLRRQLGR